MGTETTVNSAKQTIKCHANKQKRYLMATFASDMQLREKGNLSKRFTRRSSIGNMGHTTELSTVQVRPNGVFGERKDRADSTAILRSVVTAALRRKSMEDLGKSKAHEMSYLI